MEKVCSGIRVYKIYAFNKNVLSAYSVPDLVRVFRYLSNNLQYGQSVHLCDFFSSRTQKPRYTEGQLWHYPRLTNVQENDKVMNSRMSNVHDGTGYSMPCPRNLFFQTFAWCFLPSSISPERFSQAPPSKTVPLPHSLSLCAVS